MYRLKKTTNSQISLSHLANGQRLRMINQLGTFQSMMTQIGFRRVASRADHELVQEF